MEMESKERCDMACEILSATHDGDDLSTWHLKLVELAVNGFCNDHGWEAFRDLHRQVKEGYKKPWFHGIEHMTQDHEGYIHWKGAVVEHYSFDNYRKEAKAAAKLSERCRILESNGIALTMGNTVWVWNEKYAHLKEKVSCSSAKET